MKFREIVFFQDSNADEALNLLKEDEPAAFQHLLQWDYGEGEIRDYAPWGTQDRRLIFRQENGSQYVLSWNWHLNYIGLTEVIEPD